MSRDDGVSRESEHVDLAGFMEGVKRRNPGQPEFVQAVTEVAEDIFDFIQDKEKYHEAQILRRAESLRPERERSTDFLGKMRERTLRCFAALEKRVPASGSVFDLAQITTAVACRYESWRYGDAWRGVAPKLAAWSDIVAERPSMKATEPAETPQ